MPEDSQWSRYVRVLDVVGILIVLAALGMIGRFALLLTQAWGRCRSTPTMRSYGRCMASRCRTKARPRRR